MCEEGGVANPGNWVGLPSKEELVAAAANDTE